MARGVIHNIGNVLNSALISCTMIQQHAQNSRIGNLNKALALLTERKDDLAVFLSDEPLGQRLVNYLPDLAQEIVKQTNRAVDEAAQLHENLRHILSIIEAQRSVTGQFGIVEHVTPQAVAEAALGLSTLSTLAGEVTIRRKFGAMEAMPINRHRVLQILVNLLQNAWDAIARLPREEWIIEVSVAETNGEIEIRVANAGSEIPQEVVAKMFQLGFTTKSEGSGLGLHSSANSARSLGGSLLYTGENGMTVFTLRFPIVSTLDRVEPFLVRQAA
jgi:C4-dicarboxylate-specific signal transduction histidine kinase